MITLSSVILGLMCLPPQAKEMGVHVNDIIDAVGPPAAATDVGLWRRVELGMNVEEVIELITQCSRPVLIRFAVSL